MVLYYYKCKKCASTKLILILLIKIVYNNCRGENMFNIEEELKKLPAKPGVYVMRDKDDTIIYVGKAVSLKNRVRSYFRKSSTEKRATRSL